MKISKYSFGIGDRFAHEGVNQLKALDRNLDIIGREIEANIGERHVKRLFA